MLHEIYLSSLCQRRHWLEPRYTVTPRSGRYRCTVRVNNREYHTPGALETEQTAREVAATIAYNICRSFSANDGMYPTGFAHNGVIQGNPVPVGSGRHNRGSNSSLETGSYHYTSDSVGSRSGGSSPDFGGRHPPALPARSSRHSGSGPAPQVTRRPADYGRHTRRY